MRNVMPMIKNKCDICKQKTKTFKVHITKDIEERWCQECINEEEEFGYRMKIDCEGIPLDAPKGKMCQTTISK